MIILLLLLMLLLLLLCIECLSGPDYIFYFLEDVFIFYKICYNKFKSYKRTIRTHYTNVEEGAINIYIF